MQEIPALPDSFRCRFESGSGYKIALVTLSWLFLCIHLAAQVRDVALTIHLRGVYESGVSVLYITDNQTYKPLSGLKWIKGGQTSSFLVPNEKLPGEFILRFDYKEFKESTPYPSEKNILINDQDLDLRVNPKFCNSNDSTWFQEDERENTTLSKFLNENHTKNEQLKLLQNFLLSYDDQESGFYREGIREYEKKRQSYNHWLDNQIQRDKALFASTLYSLQYLPPMTWKGTEKERINSLISHYFDRMDFGNPLLVKFSGLNRWMDNYINLYGQLSLNEAMRDSLFSMAGRIAVEKARKGHPLVYGWMVDYFFIGYEKNNIPSGIRVLEPYLNDPDCLTSKRMEINRRLKGLDTLIPGIKAPDFDLKDNAGNPFRLYEYHPTTPYVLVLFWSADCNHCDELINEFSPWQNLGENSQKLSVIAISLDETATEVSAWNRKTKTLKDWKHLRPDEGIRSKVAGDYFILSTPVMILMDSGTKKIISLPSTFSQLKNALY